MVIITHFQKVAMMLADLIGVVIGQVFERDHDRKVTTVFHGVAAGFCRLPDHRMLNVRILHEVIEAGAKFSAILIAGCFPKPKKSVASVQDMILQQVKRQHVERQHDGQLRIVCCRYL